MGFEKLKEEKSIFLGILTTAIMIASSWIVSKFIKVEALSGVTTLDSLFSAQAFMFLIGLSGSVILAYYLGSAFFDKQIANIPIFAGIVAAIYLALDTYIIYASGVSSSSYLFSFNGVVYKMLIPYISAFAVLKLSKGLK